LATRGGGATVWGLGKPAAGAKTPARSGTVAKTDGAGGASVLPEKNREEGKEGWFCKYRKV